MNLKSFIQKLKQFFPELNENPYLSDIEAEFTEHIICKDCRKKVRFECRRVIMYSKYYCNNCYKKHSLFARMI